MTVWTGDAQYRFAPCLLTLLDQLRAAYPGPQWIGSPQTGTKGDARHFSEGSNSDHNPWLDNTVRALDVAANVSGVPGIVTVTDAPPAESLFAMVNAMYAARDPRVFPDGYVIFNRRITDPANPGGYKPQVGDPHLYHVHISASRNPAGYNSIRDWQLIPGERPSGGGVKLPPPGKPITHLEVQMFHLIRNAVSGALRACGPGYWVALEGRTGQETLDNLSRARSSPLCADPTVQDVSPAGMQWYKDFYVKGALT